MEPSRRRKIFKNCMKMFAEIKNICNFAPELCNASTNSSVYCDGGFLSAYNKDSIRLLNRSDSRCKTLFGARKVRFNGLFLFLNIKFLFRAMRAPNKNLSSGRDTSGSRATCESGTWVTRKSCGVRHKS